MIIKVRLCTYAATTSDLSHNHTAPLAELIVGGVLEGGGGGAIILPSARRLICAFWRHDSQKSPSSRGMGPSTHAQYFAAASGDHGINRLIDVMHEGHIVKAGSGSPGGPPPAAAAAALAPSMRRAVDSSVNLCPSMQSSQTQTCWHGKNAVVHGFVRQKMQIGNVAVRGSRRSAIVAVSPLHEC